MFAAHDVNCRTSEDLTQCPALCRRGARPAAGGGAARLTAAICGEAWQAELRSVFPTPHAPSSAPPSPLSGTALADLLQAQIPKMIA